MPNKSSPHGGYICAGTVSHGTLRTQDLLRAFADEYERLVPFNSLALVHEARGAADLIDHDDATADDCEAGSEIVNELADALDDIAHREGDYYFGTTEGDGSDFGFWS